MADTLIDFISGQEVPAGPEERNAVQPFARVLVEDYGYPKELIQTRPQWHVKVRPSDTKKEYPIDIAVFASSEHTDDTLQIVVECKKPTRMDGQTQLQDYLRMSRASLGVWFNGEERLFIHKIEHDGLIEFEEVPNIPRYGQRLEDIGRFQRSSLQPTHNLKPTFKAIRNYLAANATGATRDEVFAQQMINIIFCKIYDERFTEPDDIVTFRAGFNEDPRDVQTRITSLFTQVKRKYKDVIDKEDSIALDAKSLVYVVGELQNYCLIDSERDSVADAFETFIGHALKGAQGQFFTPRNVIRMMVEMLDPCEDDYIIDPSCGSGGFLVEALRYIWQKQEAEGKRLRWSANNLQEEKTAVAIGHISGIDKDYFLTKVAKTYMAILGDGKGGIFCEDSLENPNQWSLQARNHVRLGGYTVLLTNPPFGSKIPVSGEAKLKQFDLGYKWTSNKSGSFEKTSKLKDKEAPQILFIERDYKLLADYGRMGIVLPDGVFGNSSFGYVRDWLMHRGRILAVVDIPKETFMPNTATKTSVLFFQKLPPEEIPEDYDIFMAIAETCGHDRRGNEIEDDDVASIAYLYSEWLKNHSVKGEHE